MGAPTSPRVSMPMPGTIGVDINRDGIPDFRLAPGQTAGVDVNHDGITDYTVRNATPGFRPGMSMSMPPAPGVMSSLAPLPPPMMGRSTPPIGGTMYRGW